MTTIGERIKNLRVGQEFTQARLAELLSVGKTTVSKWESDTNIPQAKELKAMSNLFQVTSDYILGLSTELTGNYVGDDKDISKLTYHFQQLKSEKSKRACIDFVIRQVNKEQQYFDQKSKKENKCEM